VLGGFDEGCLAAKTQKIVFLGGCEWDGVRRCATQTFKTSGKKMGQQKPRRNPAIAEIKKITLFEGCSHNIISMLN
jgi:hypothetical protein